jgi:predicted transcriptional regulator
MILLTPAWRDPLGVHEALDPALQEALWRRLGPPHRAVLTRVSAEGRASLTYLPSCGATARLAVLLPETLAALEEAEARLAGRGRQTVHEHATADAQCLALVRRVLGKLREVTP